MTQMDANQALAALFAGNRRYVAGQSAHPHQTSGWRAETARGQNPFATILTCSDSRVPPEIIFDCGLGDLFVVRVAGNVLDDVVLGSIEYAAEHLGVSLVLVLGHSHCGAVTAAVEGGHAHGHIGSLTERLRPAVERATAAGCDVVDAAITANVELAVAELSASQPILAHLIAQRKLQVVGARYELETGLVGLLDV